MVLNWMKLFVSNDEVVLGQDNRDYLIARVGFHDCIQASIELSDRG